MSKKILIAEDQKDSAEFLGRFLKRRGHSVVVVNDGISAKDFIVSQQFDIVLLDCSMPGLTGPELIQDVRQFNPNAKVIIFTAYDSIDGRLAEDLGADAFLHKPIKPEEIERICDS
jgi:CheY-like chemotaxis protein